MSLIDDANEVAERRQQVAVNVRNLLDEYRHQLMNDRKFAETPTFQVFRLQMGLNQLQDQLGSLHKRQLEQSIEQCDNIDEYTRRALIDFEATDAPVPHSLFDLLRSMHYITRATRDDMRAALGIEEPAPSNA